jgi:hypothetical protein
MQLLRRKPQKVPQACRKLLKMRDFRARSGFLLSAKRATMTAPKRAIGRA